MLNLETTKHGAVFTREQAEGALPNGTRVVKIKAEEGDGHAVGERATVIGSVSHPEIMNGIIAYFVSWDDMPNVPVGVVDWKIAALEPETPNAE